MTMRAEKAVDFDLFPSKDLVARASTFDEHTTTDTRCALLHALKERWARTFERSSLEKPLEQELQLISDARRLVDGTVTLEQYNKWWREHRLDHIGRKPFLGC